MLSPPPWHYCTRATRQGINFWSIIASEKPGLSTILLSLLWGHSISLGEEDLVLETFNLSTKQLPFFESDDEVSTRTQGVLFFLTQAHPEHHKSALLWGKVHRTLNGANLFFTLATRVSLMDELVPRKALLQSNVTVSCLWSYPHKPVTIEQTQVHGPLRMHTHAHTPICYRLTTSNDGLLWASENNLLANVKIPVLNCFTGSDHLRFWNFQTQSKRKGRRMLFAPKKGSCHTLHTGFK